MNLKPFEGPGSTPSRRRFWNVTRDAVMSAQKVGGRFVTVDEHPGKGSVINVADTSARRGRGGGGVPCPDEDPATISVMFSGVGSCCLNTLVRSFFVTHPEDINQTFVLTNNDFHSWDYIADV